MFQWTKNFNQDISSWNISNVTDATTKTTGKIGSLEFLPYGFPEENKPKFED